MLARGSRGWGSPLLGKGPQHRIPLRSPPGVGGDERDFVPFSKIKSPGRPELPVCSLPGRPTRKPPRQVAHRAAVVTSQGCQGGCTAVPGVGCGRFRVGPLQLCVAV